MSSTLADLSRLEDLLYDEYGNSKFRPDIKWKATNKHKDTYEVYEIPTDFEDWFRDFGGIEHPKDDTHVMALTPYQVHFAKLDYGVMKKSNKVGMTTSELLCDFHTRLLKNTSGNDCLFTAASEDLANNLLNTLKYNVAQSTKYRQFMLPKSRRPESSEESTMSRMIIKDPWHETREGHILALGTSKSTTYSRMNINRIHISDPSRMSIIGQDDYFAGVFSRVANTSGQIKIEGVPGDRKGWFYKLCQAVFPEDMDDGGQPIDAFDAAVQSSEPTFHDDYEIPREISRIFSTSKVTIDDAVEHGLIPAAMRQFYKDTLPPAFFRRTYMAEFPLDEDAVFRAPNTYGDYAAGWSQPR